MPRWILLLALVLAASACADPADLTDAASDDPTEGETTAAPEPAAPAIRYSCTGIPFTPEELPLRPAAEAQEGEVYEALRRHVEAGTGIGEYPPGPWYELGERDGRVQFLAPHPDGGVPEGGFGVYLTLEQTGSGWEWAGADQCQPTAHHPTLGPATWVLDGAAPGPGAQTFTAQVTERACASGQAADGRVQDPVIEYREHAVVVTFFVQPQEGDATCPENLPTPFEVRLDEPLGDRQLLDAGAWPAREPFPDEHDMAEESSTMSPLAITSGPPCDDDASCSAVVVIDGVGYALSCGLINPAVVTDEVYATGEGHTVNVVEGVDPRVLVAWDHEGCGPPLEGRWHLMYAADQMGTAAHNDAWCRVSLNGADPAEGFDC